jgi:hypothetical protein
MVSGMNEQYNTYSSECNINFTQNDIKFKWLTQETKPLDDLYLDNIKAINTYLDSNSNDKLRCKEINMT